jgi:hypothetical protein
MKTFGRLALSLACTLLGFAVAFLIGFYVSLFSGANMHGTIPGWLGLGFGLIGGFFAFRAVWKATNNFAG